jgi:cyclopropane fatty-acyl-phospholipid synthase-like methyltransferase
MLEAVGHRHLGTFFRRCDELLKPDGLAVLQVITLPDQRYDVYRKDCDWIRKHIFPGGHLPSLTALCEAMTRGLRADRGEPGEYRRALCAHACRLEARLSAKSRKPRGFRQAERLSPQVALLPVLLPGGV